MDGKDSAPEAGPIPMQAHLAVVLCFVICWYGPIAVYLCYRHEKLISCRQPKYTTEAIAFLGLYVMFDTLIAMEINAPCVVAVTILAISLLKFWLPFLFIYRKIFLRYRFGFYDGALDDEESYNCLVRLSLRHCAYNKSFPAIGRCVEAVFLVIIVSTVVFLAWDVEHTNCVDTWAYYIGAVINSTFFTMLCICGYGIRAQFVKIAKSGDRLGIKSMLLRLNNLMIFAVLTFVVLILLISRDLLETRLISLTSIISIPFFVEMILVPLLLVKRDRANRLTRLSTNLSNEVKDERQYLKDFLATTDGYNLMLEFLKTELAVESIMFLKQVIEFQKLYKVEKTKTIKSSFRRRSLIRVPSAKTIQIQNENMMRDAKNIYDSFIDNEAPYLINSARFDLMQIAHEALGHKKKLSEILVNKNVFSHGDNDNDKQKKKAQLTPLIFDGLMQEQFDCLYMDGFRRFKEEPVYGNAWSEFKAKEAEISALVNDGVENTQHTSKVLPSSSNT